ncbi:hypothetical protein FBU30_005759 [Linnemannia zychae]|nr:hypothetical protein FBU30_005759 [Linnemannia zychae]
MSHHVLETTVDIFSSWPQLAQLRISTAGGRMVAQRPLETILLNSKSLHLETIELDNIIFWDYYTIHRLVDMNQNTLRNLSVTRCYYYLNGIERELSKSPLLESLQLRHCYPLELDEDEDVTELEALQSILEKHPRIKHLSLGEWTKLESSTMTLFSRACPSLVSLELVECDIGSEGVRQFLIHCPHLRKLRIDLLNSPNVMELFLGEPWKCQQLEEIWIEEIVNDNKRQINSYHYCGMLDEDRRQCLVYDDDSEHAKLIAFEYIISQKLFESLDENEKKYWHSHKYEIESGLLVQTAKRTDSGSTEFSEISSLQKLIDTYGKTIQLWPVDKQGKCSSKVPTGPPQILVSFTADSQVDPDLLRQRDEIMGIKTEDKKNERKGRVQGAPVDKDADQWISKGKPWQVYDNGNNGAVETRQ